MVRGTHFHTKIKYSVSLMLHDKHGHKLPCLQFSYLYNLTYHTIGVSLCIEVTVILQSVISFSCFWAQVTRYKFCFLFFMNEKIILINKPCATRINWLQTPKTQLQPRAANKNQNLKMEFSANNKETCY